MIDCLMIIVDKFADSVGLPAMGHLGKKMAYLFSRQEYCLLRKASVAHVDRRLLRYYLIVRRLPNVFALACRS